MRAPVLEHRQPGIDPKISIKIFLLGPLFNIRFVRQTVKEVQCANLVAATAQNMKKLANLLAEKRPFT